jgi:hypothetical protein
MQYDHKILSATNPVFVFTVFLLYREFIDESGECNVALSWVHEGAEFISNVILLKPLSASSSLGVCATGKLSFQTNTAFSVFSYKVASTMS